MPSGKQNLKHYQRFETLTHPKPNPQSAPVFVYDVTPSFTMVRWMYMCIPIGNIIEIIIHSTSGDADGGECGMGRGRGTLYECDVIKLGYLQHVPSMIWLGLDPTR